jgi:hypothetical protein
MVDEELEVIGTIVTNSFSMISGLDVVELQFT